MADDRGRAELYAAEVAAFDGTDLEMVVGVEAIVALGRRLLAGDWWPGPPVEVVAARRDARSSTTRCPGTGDGRHTVIRIAGPQATRATLAHELAHALAGVAAGHGPRFRRAYLDLVEALTNLEPTDRRGHLHVEQLAAAFSTAGLPAGDRAWPPPGAAGPIAL